MTSTVLVFTGGDAVPPRALTGLPPDAIVVAADSGIEHALASGRAVDVAVGDFDSVSPGALAIVTDAGTTVERHPAEKDQTDLELALDRALGFRPRRLVVIGGHGGRLDHFFGNAFLLTSAKYREVELEARFGDARLHVVRSSLTLRGDPGALVSLLAVTEPVHGITTMGLRYPLHDETLHPGSSRGISNEYVDGDATITVSSGTLLVIQPDAGG